MHSEVSTFHLTSSVSALPGVGPVRKEQLERLGIETIQDLLYYAPFRYEEIEKPVSLADLVVDTKATFKAEVQKITPIKTRKFRSMLKVVVSDGDNKIDLTWFNVPYVLTALKVWESYYFTGKVGEFKGKKTLTNPTFQIKEPDVGALVPVYHETAKLTSKWLRKVLKQVLEALPHTTLVSTVISKEHEQRALELEYIELEQALRYLHRPPGEKELQQAKQRLAFDEMLLLIQDVVAAKKQLEQSKAKQAFKVSEKDIEQFIKMLPYQPTESQQEALQAVAKDLNQENPMHRLLQGEVGSGKTTVAAFALWVAARNKQQSILICPTKILAEQHAESLAKLFKGTDISIGLMTGEHKQKDADIVVGTHALFFDKTIDPALVIIDEEHRFGVEQRRHFFKQNPKPDLLSMTATPIPRTVALTALADYDVSFLQPHRKADTVKTWVVPEKKRKGAYTWLKERLEEETTPEENSFKSQAIIVCPFIDTSSIETLQSVKSAQSEYKKLKKKFSRNNVALLHGKMSDAEKTKLFTKTMEGSVDILVTTPVVEVGVDIPGADAIIIEGAERFGLAQLHQLRGRVGRRGQQAFCLLFVSEDFDGDGTVSNRLKFFAETYDGNKLAEYDLKRRGSGELLGTRQHGFGNLQFASWFDTKLIEQCRVEVERMHS